MTTSKGTLNSQENQHQKWMPVLICLALAVLTVAAFIPIKDSGFISLDDDIYVYENTYIQSGLNANSIKQAFSSELAKVGHWHPLTWLSLMLDHQIFGLNPSGYHLVNLLFHVVNTLLLFLILRRMTKSLWPSAFVAALFAIHPLHVESVAWITERKDVLSTFFWMLTLGAYSYYVEHRGFRRYVFVLLFFTLGLLSKPMLVTLPFVLLLLDYWPLGRFSEFKPIRAVQTEILKSAVSGRQKKKSRKKVTEKGVIRGVPEVRKPATPESPFKWTLIYPLLLEKVPLFALAILSSIAAFLAAHSAGAVHTKDIPLGVRIGNASISYVAYIGKMILPINLAVFYPHPNMLVLWQVLGAAFLLIVITAAVIRLFRDVPYLITGWFWYLGTLVPVIGIVQAGSQAMADRYTYIPLIGLFIVVAWGVEEILRRWGHRQELFVIVSALCILCLSILTWRQGEYWENSSTLFDHTLKVTENNWFIHNSRGSMYNKSGNYNQAIDDYNRAIAYKPDYADAYNNRGNAYSKLDNYSQAIEDYNKTIAFKPDYAEAYNNRGSVYHRRGEYAEAIDDYCKAIQIKPDDATFYINRSIAYEGLGNKNMAVGDLKKAARLGDERVRNYLNLNGISWQ